jgi:hypothetical protein
MKIYNYITIAIILVATSCEKSDMESIGGENSSIGKSGSMAKFSISGDNLFLINEKDLKIYDISTASQPNEINTLEVDYGIETAFSLGDKLFIGSVSGVYIYDVTNPMNILYLSHYTHITSCDPVVANDTLAFATLNSQSECRWQTGINRLDVIDIQNIVYPNLISGLNMDNPKGLAIDSTFVFVCNGQWGVDIYDFSDPYDLEQVSGITGIDSYDIILDNDILYLVGKDGLFQYDYSDIYHLELLSNLLF